MEAAILAMLIGALGAAYCIGRIRTEKSLWPEIDRMTRRNTEHKKKLADYKKRFSEAESNIFAQKSYISDLRSELGDVQEELTIEKNNHAETALDLANTRAALVKKCSEFEEHVQIITRKIDGVISKQTTSAILQ